MSAIAEADHALEAARRGASILDDVAAASARRPAVSALPPLPLAQALERAQGLLAPPTNGGSGDYPLEALGPLAEAARDLAAGAQLAPAMAGQSLLAAAALLVQSTANVQTLDGSTKPLSLYCLTIANSGDGKDTADRPALRPVHAFQRQAGPQWEADRAAYEDAKASRNRGDATPEPMGPAPYRLAADLTIEGLRRSFVEGVAAQGIFSTEAAIVLAGHAMQAEHRTNTAANLCGIWDRGHLSAIRGGAGRTERYGVRLSAHLLIQPAALGDVLNDESLAGVGFWPRFLLAWPAPLEPRKYKPWKPESSEALRRYWGDCERLLARPMPVDCDALPVIELDSGATRHMARFFEGMEYEGRKGDLRDVRPFTLRATELACRIAGVLAAFAGIQTIDVGLAECGAVLAAHALDNWQAALAGKADPVPGWASTLYRWLATRGDPVAIRDLTKLAPASVRPRSRRDAAIDRLKACGLVAMDEGDIGALGVDHARN
ncbi:conserved hypothetical protein [Thiomonas sp. X19]|uniref:DUF3987 domain-containing protein n=1 Tax=mine drainage metagenome TaxID=410659 RepID=E6PNI4_9ZZZZ|nr:DUF3987 domain-containing protein [Thiomonas sp. X19]SCC94779.1 conserved hypothetical protein [Thiomonas sp. X19]